jgi:molybdopterin converting factor subunit 1
MRVHVLFFGVLRETFGDGATIELPDGSMAGTVLMSARDRAPQLGELWGRVAIAVNQSYVGAETVLADGDEVALLPPVSGGCVAIV